VGANAYLHGAVLENHLAGEQKLLSWAGDEEVPASAMVCEGVGDMAALGGHGEHCEFLEGLSICRGGCGKRLWKLGWVAILECGRKGSGCERILGRGKVKGRVLRAEESWATRVGEGGCVNIHGGRNSGSHERE
jgi:hypothetical protein